MASPDPILGPYPHQFRADQCLSRRLYQIRQMSLSVHRENQIKSLYGLVKYLLVLGCS